MFRLTLKTCLLVIATTFCASVAQACPFCEPIPTLRQDIEDHVAVVIVELTGGEDATEDEPGTSVFTVRSTIKTHEGQPRLNDEITIPGASSKPLGSRQLMMARRLGTNIVRLDWNRSFDIDDTRLKYITSTPTEDATGTQQLAYFLKYLEHPDFFISNDAFAEFTNVRFEDIYAIRDHLPRDQLRDWVFGERTPTPRRGLYGMLLGLCGNQADAQRLEDYVLAPAKEWRLPADGMMGGYLWLKGEAGLAVLDANKFVLEKPEQNETEITPRETYSALQALRFMWQYGGERIPRERMKVSLRLLLKRPQFVEVAITDLSRWKDWTVLDQITAMALDPAAEPSLRVAASRFVWQCSRDIPKTEDKLPAHVVDSRAALLRIQAANPELKTLLENLDKDVRTAKGDVVTKRQ